MSRRIKIAIFNDTAGEDHYGCELVMSQMQRRFVANGFDVLWTHPVGTDWRSMLDELDKRPAVEAIVVNGEGSIHHSHRSPRAKSLTELGRFARDHWAVPAYIVNATITGLEADAVEDLRAFSGIYVRESGSAAELAEFGVSATVVPDLTFCVDAVARSQSPQGVLVTDSVRKNTASALKTLARRRGWAFEPMRRKAGSWFIREPRHRLDAKEFLNLLAAHSFVITGRFHTVTLAIVSAVPFLALESNTSKIRWLLQDVFGSSRRLIPQDVVGTLSASHLRVWTAVEIEQAAAYVTSAPARVDQMLQDINRDICVRCA